MVEKSTIGSLLPITLSFRMVIIAFLPCNLDHIPKISYFAVILSHKYPGGKYYGLIII